MKKQHGPVKRIFAKRCDICPPCRYARANPGTKVGKAIAWHGKYCPFWNAWKDVYGDETEPTAPAKS